MSLAAAGVALVAAAGAALDRAVRPQRGLLDRHRLALRPPRRPRRRHGRRPGARLLPARHPLQPRLHRAARGSVRCSAGPLVGFMVGSVTGDPTAWHDDRRSCGSARRLTWLLAPPARVGVLLQGPVWLARLAGRHRHRHRRRHHRRAPLGLGWPLQLAALVGDGLAPRPQRHAAGARRHRRACLRPRGCRSYGGWATRWSRRAACGRITRWSRRPPAAGSHGGRGGRLRPSRDHMAAGSELPGSGGLGRRRLLRGPGRAAARVADRVSASRTLAALAPLRGGLSAVLDPRASRGLPRRGTTAEARKLAAPSPAPPPDPDGTVGCGARIACTWCRRPRRPAVTDRWWLAVD